MPLDDPDPTDPMTLQGVVFETDSDEALRDMAECFVEEYLRSGFDADRILKMFQTKGYAGPLLAYQSLGRDTIVQIIDDQLTLRGDRRDAKPTVPGTSRRISLTVLDS